MLKLVQMIKYILMPYLICQNSYINMNKTQLLLLLTLAVLKTINSTILITSPQVTPFIDNKLDYFYANFGDILYGKSLAYDLALIDSGLCKQVEGMQHFTQPTYVVIKATISQGCSFTKRALIAQGLGAKGIIIATVIATYAEGNVINVEDGNGKKVHIAVLFIKNQQFDKLAKLGKVEIMANYPIPKSQVSKISLFLSASKRNSYTFLNKLKSHYQLLTPHIKLQPIYQTIECNFCNPLNCYFDHLYCTFDYEYQHLNIGQMILREQLTQQAIYSKFGVVKWMEYMNLFYQYCEYNWIEAETCGRRILRDMKIGEVSLGNPADTMRDWRIRQTKIGFANFPQVAVNSMVYTGNLNIDLILNFICQSLQTPPPHCLNNPTTTKQTTTYLYYILIASGSILLVTFIICLGCWVYRQFIHRELTDDITIKVNQLVARYATKVSDQGKQRKERLAERFQDQL